MEIVRDDEKKLIHVWLTNQEREDDALQSRLKSMYAGWKQQKYTVAVFQSGSRDLSRSTLDLLAYNKANRRTGSCPGKEEMCRAGAIIGTGNNFFVP